MKFIFTQKLASWRKPIFFTLITMIVGFSYLIWQHNQIDESVAINKATEKISVIAYKISYKKVAKQVESIGALSARSVLITPEISGHVERIHFKDGSIVKSKQLLVELNSELYKVRYDSSMAQLDYHINDLHRKKLLYTQGVLSKQAIDQVESTVKEKRAQVNENLAMLHKMFLRAPFDGMVGKSEVEIGDYVATGQKIVILTDIDHLRVEYNMPEEYIADLHVGQKVKFTTTAYPKKYFEAYVSYIAPIVNSGSRSVSVYATIDNVQHELTAGMFVKVVQELGFDSSAVVIPSRCLLPSYEGMQIYKVIDNKVVLTNIEIARRIKDDVVIKSGLKIGDQVVTDGQMKLKNGASVVVSSEFVYAK